MAYADTKLVLTVGSDKFEFSRLEIPEKITFGGKQNLAIHELVGGVRVIDAMGRSDMPLGWSGLLQGTNALARARYLDYLRTSGKLATLTWSELSYQVTLESFEADFQRFYQIPYRLSFAVIKDLANPTTAIQTAGIDELVAADLKRGDISVSNIGKPGVTSSWQSLKSSFAAAKSMAHATVAQINTIKSNIQSVQTQVKQAIAETSNTLKQITTLGGLVPNNGAARWVNSTTAQATNIAQQGELHNLQSTVGRLAKNVGH